MNKLENIRYLLLLCLASFLWSCKPGVPDRYVQPDKMADILYEYHLADAVVSASQGTDSIAMRAFQANILDKYGVTQSDFDSSMVYYCRHTGLLEDVYRRVSDKIENASLALGMNAADGFGETLCGGDTTDVWKEERAFVMSPYPAVNCHPFEIKADTSYHEGDAFALDFDVQFLYQDGMRRAVAVMAVYYEGDSVAVATSQMSSSSHYHLQIGNEGHLGVKMIKGFWMLSEDKSLGSATTLKVMTISGIRLIRMHQAAAIKENTDSIAPPQKTLPDSSAEQRPNTAGTDYRVGPLSRRNKALPQ